MGRLGEGRRKRRRLACRSRKRTESSQSGAIVGSRLTQSIGPRSPRARSPPETRCTSSNPSGSGGSGGGGEKGWLEVSKGMSSIAVIG